MPRIVFVVAALMLAHPAIAEDQPGPSNFFFVLESTVESADVGRWADAMSQTATAHAAHPNGNSWAAYRMRTGGPETVVRLFFPLDQLADLDEWVSTRKILVDILGGDQGRSISRDLESDAISSDRIVKFNAELSRPWDEMPPSHPRYFWVATVRVKSGKLIEYASVFRRLRRAHDLHDSGAIWLAYSNAVGGNSEELQFFYPFDTFSEIDGWPSRKEVLTDAYGAAEAARIASALEAVSETSISLWQLEPALSQLEE